MKNNKVIVTGKSLDEYIDGAVEMVGIPHIIYNLYCDIIHALDEDGVDYEFKEVEKVFMNKVIEEFDEVTVDFEYILGCYYE